MYYNDVSITITQDFAVQVGLINVILIITGEADIDDGNSGFLKISGNGAKAEFEKWLADNSKTAPKALQAVINATSQADSSGNPLIPPYVYVAGKSVIDWESQSDLTPLQNFIEMNTNAESDFWALAIVDYSKLMTEWAVTYCNAHRKGYYTIVTSKSYVPADLEKSNRIYSVYNGKESVSGSYDRSTEQWTSAIAGRTVVPSKLTATKFKTCAGMTPYRLNELTDAEVNTLASNGVNTYLYRYGKGMLDGSFTNDSDGTQKVVNHIDTMFIRDNIVFNLRKNVYSWLNQSEFAGMEDYAELEAVCNSVLKFFADNNFIATDSETGVQQFKVTVPVPSSQDRKERLMNSSFIFMPNNAVEWVTISGQEVFDFIGGEQ